MAQMGQFLGSLAPSELAPWKVNDNNFGSLMTEWGEDIKITSTWGEHEYEGDYEQAITAYKSNASTYGEKERLQEKKAQCKALSYNSVFLKNLVWSFNLLTAYALRIIRFFWSGCLDDGYGGSVVLVLMRSNTSWFSFHYAQNVTSAAKTPHTDWNWLQKI